MIIGFTGSPLDRADALRHDAQALAAAARHPAARLLFLPGYVPEVDEGGGLIWAPLDELAPGTTPVLLGLDGAVPCFVAMNGERPPRGRSAALNAALDRLRPGEAEVYAIARALLGWHATHGFCPNCGAATEVARGGWMRLCPACGTEHFPRTDPVVIMLPILGDRALVARQPRWPAGRYSALAGFLEPGESVEEAVAREVMEEAGVRVTGVRYLASQPWPFPSQLMLACLADAADDALTVDGRELEAAMWVTRSEVRAALAGAADRRFTAPPPYAIAHTLLAHWAQG